MFSKVHVYGMPEKYFANDLKNEIKKTFRYHVKVGHSISAFVMNSYKDIHMVDIVIRVGNRRITWQCTYQPLYGNALVKEKYIIQRNRPQI